MDGNFFYDEDARYVPAYIRYSEEELKILREEYEKRQERSRNSPPDEDDWNKS
jgi:hypothetical protein